MFSLHKLLYKLSPLRYGFVIILITLSSFILTIGMNSFIEEKTSFSYLLPIGVNQLIMILQYILIRSLYRNELLLMQDDSIHLFMQSAKSRYNMFKNKISQIVLFFTIQFMLTVLFIILLSSTIESVYLIISSVTISFILTVFVYSIDFININKIIKNNIESILSNIILVEIVALFYNPSVLLLVGCCITILIAIPINLNRIRRNL